ncbi:hypothetical protein H5J24_00650 [Chryseobacterium capnotolerans]|uniref:hypothetical protein n=1 Tax=Chryseobacterium TaxID=59732 RepID=UPI00083A40CD|nr:MULTISPECIES: hypothetical protein [Chryseobacterium]UHO38745.1 hypothetical protein H5J24_00650 [Chryseobacterium capnotolerans]
MRFHDEYQGFENEIGIKSKWPNGSFALQLNRNKMKKEINAITYEINPDKTVRSQKATPFLGTDVGCMSKQREKASVKKIKKGYYFTIKTDTK